MMSETFLLDFSLTRTRGFWANDCTCDHARLVWGYNSIVTNSGTRTLFSSSLTELTRETLTDRYGNAIFKFRLMK